MPVSAVLLVVVVVVVVVVLTVSSTSVWRIRLVLGGSVNRPTWLTSSRSMAVCCCIKGLMKLCILSSCSGSIVIAIVVFSLGIKSSRSSPSPAGIEMGGT